MIVHRLLHIATLLKVNVMHALHFIAESWGWVTRMAVVNCFHKFEFNLSEVNDGGHATELSIDRDDRGQLKGGVLLEECVS